MAYEHSGSIQMGSRKWLIMNWLHRVKAIFGIQYRKYFGFANVGKIPSSVGIWYFGLLIALFRSRGSMHILILPGFTIVTMLLIYAVESSTGVMIPCLVNWSSLCFR